MKHEIPFRIFTVLLTVLFLAGGCPMGLYSPSDGPEPVRDDASQGIMRKATADKVFEYREDPRTGGVVIEHFKDEKVLKDYLEGGARQAGGRLESLYISEINGRPVTRIAEAAFKPGAWYPADITTVVKKITLPETIKVLGKEIFAGTGYFVEVDIPSQAVKNIKAFAKEEMIAEKMAKLDLAGMSAAAIEATLTAFEKDVEESLDTLVEMLVVNAVAGSAVRVTLPLPSKPGGLIVGPKEAKVPAGEKEPARRDPTETPELPEGIKVPDIFEESPSDSPSQSSVINMNKIELSGPTANAADAAASTITETDQFTGMVIWKPALEANNTFAADTLYTATIILTAKPNYTLQGLAADFFDVDGAITSNAANSGVVTAVFSAIRADSVEGLSNAVAEAKTYNQPEGGAVILLSPGFYTDANGSASAIVVDPGNTDNGTAYTIRGLGKEGNSKKLNVGIFLANDNVTLEKVNINVTQAAKAAPTMPWTDTSSYIAGVSIGRSADGTIMLDGAARPAKNVTVTDSTITIRNDGTKDDSPFTAGIFIGGGRDVLKLASAKNITISGNTITAVGNGGSATQGIAVTGYDYSQEITGNTISAQYGNPNDRPKTAKRYNAPASALYFNLVCGEDMMGSSGGEPKISNNIITFDTDPSYAYSFYFTAWQTFDQAVVDQHPGVDSMRNYNFALANTTWALPSTNNGNTSYKKLFNALLANIPGDGFGHVAIPHTITTHENEQYKIEDGKITVISVLGDHIVNGKYAGNDKNNTFSSDGSVPKGVDYGSFTVSNGVPGSKNGKYYFAFDTQDNDYIYNN
jgi:hypothetical protein